MAKRERRLLVKKSEFLTGKIECEGSKNASLMCLAGAALADSNDEITLYNVPSISDVDVFVEIMRICGKSVHWEKNVLRMKGRLQLKRIPTRLTSAIRASSYLIGIFLSVLGNVEDLGVPGGDRIGERPLDIHLENMRKMGIEYVLTGGKLNARVVTQVYGKTLYLKFPSVGATCNLILLAINAVGKTIILNAAKEPEVVELGNLLVKMGAKLSGVGTDHVTVWGGIKLKGNVEYTISADRIETATYMVVASLVGKNIKIQKCIPYHNYPLIYVLRSIGIKVECDDDSITISRGEKLLPLNVIAMPFPGIATDIQPLLVVLAISICGNSVISDLVFPDRFQYIYELIGMGAKIEKSGNKLDICGGEIFGKAVEGNDIRAVVALICAGLIANGTTEIRGIQHLNRGYANIVTKLKLIGADISVS